MKRETFKIEYDGVVVLRSKWNSALREIEAIVRKIAKDEACSYELVASESIRGEFKKYERGSRSWMGNGRVIVFNVSKVG